LMIAISTGILRTRWAVCQRVHGLRLDRVDRVRGSAAVLIRPFFTFQRIAFPLSHMEGEESNTAQESTPGPNTEATTKIKTNSNRCYVGNLSYVTRWTTLKDHMRQAGEVVFADVMLDSHTGRSKGCGIVEYKTIEDAQHAIDTLNDSKLDNRLIFIREDRERPPPRSTAGRGYGAIKLGQSAGRGEIGSSRNVSGGDDAGKKIFIGNLPYTTSWQDLKDLFGRAGKVTRAEVSQSEDGHSKGCGTVLFETKEAAQQAITDFDGEQLAGRRIHVRAFM